MEVIQGAGDADLWATLTRMLPFLQGCFTPGLREHVQEKEGEEGWCGDPGSSATVPM